MPITKQTYGSLNPLLNTPKVTTPAVSGVPVNQPTRPVATTPKVTAPVNTRQSQIDSITAQANAIKAQIPTATGLTPSTTYGNNLAVDSASNPADIAITEEIARNKVARDANVNDEQIYRDKLKQYQGQIDAVNQIYREKINQSQLQGQGKLGTGRAIQGRSGLLGSDFAAAQNDTITQGNNDILSGIYGEQSAAIQAIEGLARKDAQDEATAKRAAKEAGSANYLKFLGEQETRKSGRLDNFIKSVGSTDLSTISPTNLAEVAKSYGISVDTLKSRVKEAQDAQKSEIAKQEREGIFTLSEGQSRYDAQGNVIASKGKTATPGSGSGSGSGTGSIPVSSAAQGIIDQINLGASLDDLIKGSSNAAQALRNEVVRGLNAQGGRTDKDNAFLKEAKSVADSLIATNAQNALGGQSVRFGGQYTTAYGDAQARVSQLQSMLTRDNLGLLKGAMSDKDVAFINSMSSGLEGAGIQSESFIKERLDSIQQKLADKIAQSTVAPKTTNPVNQTPTKTDPLGLGI